MHAVALIPARGGSKGLKRKNMFPLSGIPLIEHTIRAALGAKQISKVYVSSDDEQILEFSEQKSAETVLRPIEIAQDTTPMAPVIDHFITTSSISMDTYIVLLQPTSPLRNSKHIDASFQTMKEKDKEAVISVCKAESHHPYKALKLRNDGSLEGIIDNEAPFSRRQDCPDCYFANGAIYIFRCRDFKELGQIPLTRACPYEMPPHLSIDIDTQTDIKRIESGTTNDW